MQILSEISLRSCMYDWRLPEAICEADDTMIKLPAGTIHLSVVFRKSSTSCFKEQKRYRKKVRANLVTIFFAWRDFLCGYCSKVARVWHFAIGNLPICFNNGGNAQIKKKRPIEVEQTTDWYASYIY